MGKKTVKITKAKNVSFMRLSLFYLIFIVQIFFTSPGMYVLQYPDVVRSQTMVNERLKSELAVYTPLNDKQEVLKNTTIECLAELEQIKKAYYEYKKRTGVSGDRLREAKFAETEIRNGKYGVKIKNTIDKFLTAYNPLANNNLTEDLVSLRDNKNIEFEAIYYYFRKTPNGVVPTILEHFKTVFLYNSILALKDKESELPKFQILSLDETDFIQKFKENLILGEPLDLLIRPKELGKKPMIKINGREIGLDSVNPTDFKLYYMPPRIGQYSLEVSTEEKRLMASFTVVPPSFRFVNNATSVSGHVGEKMYVTLDSSYVPRSNNIMFTCASADVVKDGWTLTITPKKEGLFEVFMKRGEEIIDKSTFVATLEPEQAVSLMDVGGNPVELGSANKLEAKNPFWQVVDFNMSVIYPNGELKKVHSSTRFLRNTLRELEAEAPIGSILIFDNIRLVGQSEGYVSKGSPLIKVKS